MPLRRARPRPRPLGAFARAVAALAALAATSLGAGCTSPAATTDAAVDDLVAGPRTFNVMAPLVVGDLGAPRAPEGEAAWARFEGTLREAKALGAHAVSTDVWWGAVEPEDQRFRWDYYDRLSDAVLAAGLDWVPILSFHQCGGNVGDDCDVPLPAWLGPKYRDRGAVEHADDLFYRSARGNVSREVTSVWATPLVLADFRELMGAFQEHFAPKAARIAEVNVSLGAAGELRYPAYNAHDPGAGFPLRGTLQSHGRLAVASFRRAMLERYGSLAGVAAAWGVALAREEDVLPPSDGEGFFDGRGAFGAYGRDFTGWYQASLLAHGRAVLGAAVEVFDAPGAPFRSIDLGAKVPGVHWRVATDRAAEVTSGLLRTEDEGEWFDETKGAGYGPIVALFAEVGRLPDAPRVVLHFTCLEMDDDPAVASRAKSLVFWVGKYAHARRVPIKGENALAGTLRGARAWDNMGDALAHGGYRGLTVLRVDDVVGDPLARARFRELTTRFSGRER